MKALTKLNMWGPSSYIDDAVEKCENYEERISQEYGIITKSELCESNTGQPTQ